MSPSFQLSLDAAQLFKSLSTVKGVGGETDEKTTAAVHAYRRRNDTLLCVFNDTPLCVLNDTPLYITLSRRDRMSVLQTRIRAAGFLRLQ